MLRNVYIEIGKTDGFHYLGVQPPSAVESIDIEQLELPYAAYITSTGIDRVEGNTAYFHVGYDSSCESPEQADISAVETAKKLAKLIRESTGLGVDIRTDVQRIGFGKDLFEKG